MENLILSQYENIDFPEEFRVLSCYNSDASTEMHTHDYYELIVTHTPNINHLVNGKNFCLENNSIVFIRPHDSHRFYREDKLYSFTNLAVSCNMLDKMFVFLGKSFPSKLLLSSDFPPVVNLSENDAADVKELFNKLNTIKIDDTYEKHIFCKMLLTTIFIRYFSHYKTESAAKSVPGWLSDLRAEMLNSANFVSGMEAMLRISGKSKAHLSRSFKKYYNETIVDFLTDLRLNYAANLLKNSNLSITDIIYECGYNNPGYFFYKFKEKYGVSPKKYRDK